MVDRIDKTLQKMSFKERLKVLEILDLVKAGRVSTLDLKKMQGADHVYRVRTGSFRIIFQMVDRESIRIIDVDRRSDTTYNAV